MSEAKPKRSFWQFHLSTVAVMTLTAGGFVGLNFLIRPAGNSIWMSDAPHHSLPYMKRGWPFLVQEFYTAKDGKTWYTIFGDPESEHYFYRTLNLLGITGNILILVALLFAVVVFAESLIRRREARKT